MAQLISANKQIYTPCTKQTIAGRAGGDFLLLAQTGTYVFTYFKATAPGNPGKNTGPSCQCAGDPITLGTGNEFHEDVDAELGPLSIHRYYNSENQTASPSLGDHWRHSFDRSVQLETSGGKTIATVFRQDGRTRAFTRLGSVWATDSDVSDRLTTEGTGWSFFDSSTRNTETYNANGQLTSIVDYNGMRTALTYSTVDTPPETAPTAGLLLTVTDSKGRQISFKYSAGFYTWTYRVSTISLPDGGSLQYGYTGRNLTQITYPDGRIRHYVYDLQNAAIPWPSALTGIIDEAGALYTEIGYDEQGRAVSSQLAGGVDPTFITYNDDGTTSVRYATGSQTTLTFGVIAGTVHTLTASTPCGRSCGQPHAAASYDSNGYLASTTDFNGSVTRPSHDSTGLLIQLIEASGQPSQRTTDTTWDTTFRVPLLRTVKDDAGSIVLREGWAYNSIGQTTAACLIDSTAAPAYVCSASGVAPPGVRRTVNTYCTVVDATECPLTGLLLTTDGPRTDVNDAVANTYYLTTDEAGCRTLGGNCHRAGDLKSTTDGAGLVTTYVGYDKAGRPTRIRSPSGVLTDYTYTPRGWLATMTVRADTAGVPSPADAVTTIEYEPTGTVHSVRDPDGVTTTYTYDAAHRLTDITDGTGARIHYTLDAAGNRTSEQVLSPTGAVIRSLSRSFNALGQLTALTDGLGRTVFSAGFGDSYDGNGNLVHSRDGLGVQQQQSYDALNRLVSTIRDYQGSNNATANAQSVTTFDPLDRVTAFSDPDGLSTTYDIDAFGNVTGLHSPDTGTTIRTYDAAGDLLTSVDAAQIAVNYSHDALGRLTTTTYPDASLNVTYRYDEEDAITGCAGGFGKSHLTRVIESNGGIVYCYDGHGNVVKKQQTVGAVTTTTSYMWTLGDRLESVTTATGTVIAYDHDANGRIGKVTATPPGGVATTIASDVTYQSFGPIASYTLGNGQTVTRTYDANGQLANIDSTAFTLHLGRDVMGNIVALGDSPGVSSALETYGYDPLYRLTGVNDPSGSPIEAYTYNKTGDRLSKAAPGLLTGNYRYQPDTHLLVGVGATTRVVDARGNTIANVLPIGTFGYGYNQRNRLTEVQKDGVTVGIYTLNPLGQRIQKTVGTTSTRFDYDEAGQLQSEIADGIARDYVWLGNLPIGTIDHGGSVATIGYIHADGLGSPRTVTDGFGAVQWEWPYAGNPFGEDAPVSNAGYTLNLRSPGQYFDAASGLNYNINRDYEPATGRYIQSDPIGLDGGVSTYLYVGGDPLSYVDPLGLCMMSPDGWSWGAKNPGEDKVPSGPKWCPMPFPPNQPLKPLPGPEDPSVRCSAAFLEKQIGCFKKCLGPTVAACEEAWRIKVDNCVIDNQ